MQMKGILADIDNTEIHCLQRKLNGEVVVTFKTIAAKEKFLRLNSLKVNSENYATTRRRRSSYLTLRLSNV